MKTTACILMALSAMYLAPVMAQDAPAEPETTAPAPEKKMAPGAKAKVWLRKNRMPSEDVVKPQGVAMGIKTDTSASFSEGFVLKDPKFKSVKNKPVIIKWSGFIKVEKAGNYNVMIETMKPDGTYSIEFDGTVSIAGQQIFKFLNSRIAIEGSKESNKVDTQDLALESGYYPIEVVFSLSYIHSGFARRGQIETTLKLRHEDDEDPIIISPKTMYHEAK